MTKLYCKGDYVALVHAMDIGQNPRPGFVSKEG